jgi:hypothetical protein
LKKPSNYTALLLLLSSAAFLSFIFFLDRSSRKKNLVQIGHISYAIKKLFLLLFRSTAAVAATKSPGKLGKSRNFFFAPNQINYSPFYTASSEAEKAPPQWYRFCTDLNFPHFFCQLSLKMFGRQQ